MLSGISPIHLILILAIALIVVGPGKLPDVGAALGKSIKEFRKAATDVQEATSLAPAAPAPAPAPAPAAPAPAPMQAAPAPIQAAPVAAPAAPVLPPAPPSIDPQLVHPAVAAEPPAASPEAGA